MKYTYYDYQGTMREFDVKDNTLERPDADRILKDFQKNISPYEHPRLMADKKKFEHIKRELLTDDKLKFMLERITGDAEKALDLREVTDFLDAHKHSGLPAGNASCRLYTVRLRDFSFLWQITGERKYAEAAYIILDKMSELKDWRPGEFLICSEAMTAVSIAYDWCYDYLETIEGAKEKIETAIFRKGVMAGVGAYNEDSEDVINGNPFGRYGWCKADSNWNHISNSGCIVAALAVMEQNPQLCSNLISNALQSMECGFFGYSPDGGYIEGPSYWAYGTNYVSYCIMALEHTVGTNYGIFDATGFSGTCYYRPYVMGTSVNPDEPGARMHWNYHDSGTGLISTAMFMWFAHKLKAPELAAMRYKEIQAAYNNKVSEKMYAYETATPFDFIYYDKNNFADDIKLPLDKYFKGIETVFMRSEWDNPDAVYTGLHGGHNNFNHCQLDSGNFIIDAKGIRWITELGMGNYALPGYFQPGASEPRWKYYSTRAESHNTLIVNPGKAPDQVVDSFAPIIKYESDIHGCIAAVDMCEANGKDKVKKALRGLQLTNNRRTVVVQDEIVAVEPSEIYWFAHITKDISIETSADGKKAVLSKNGYKLNVELICSEPDAKFEIMPAVKLPSSEPTHELESKNENYYKLAIHLANVSELNMAVIFQFEEDSFKYEMTPVDEWKI